MPPSFADYRIAAQSDGAAPGRGQVWLARPPARLGLDGDVALVGLGPIDDADWAVITGRLSELASVRSPHLPALLEAGRERQDGRGPGWVTRDHPQARPLGPDAPPEAALAAVAAAARAAHDLHEAGWAHGDIRGGTILLDAGQALLDLPLATAIDLPPTVARVGAPEELDGVEPDRLWGAGPTRASDVYALGAVLHRHLTRGLLHPDLPGDPVVTAVQRVLVERPRVDTELHGPAADLVRACLDPDPARRPPSALAVAERLEELAAA